jgi:hypothetical protein
MPLPDLLESGNLWVARLDDIGKALTADIVTAARVACLSPFGVNLLQQRFIWRAMPTKMGMMRRPCEMPAGPTVSPVVWMMPKRAQTSMSVLCHRWPGPWTPMEALEAQPEFKPLADMAKAAAGEAAEA